MQNDDKISILLSVNFTWKDWERAKVYRANFLLRKIGPSPRPLHESAFVDAAKNAIIASSYMPAFNRARGTVRFLRRLKGDPGDGFRPASKTTAAK